MARASDETTNYAKAAVAGKLVVGRLVRLACRRHLADLRSAKARGFYFDVASAQHAFDFFRGVLRHSKGEYAGRTFELLDWQKFVVGSIFGWKRIADRRRRFRTAFVSTARKNGKSTLEAGIGLYCLTADDEPGAEIYSAATTRDQARIVFSEAVRMRDSSPALMKRIVSRTNNLAVIASSSWFRPLSADASKMDGLNVHVALVDELHEHPSSAVVDKLDTGMGARRQPLMYETTTAGVDPLSICRQHWNFSTNILEGTIPPEAADSWFCYIATCDDDDDWHDERAYAKANPSLGVNVQLADLRRHIATAREMASKQNAVRRLYLNQWTQQITRWLDMDVWARGSEPVVAAGLRGRPCWGGLDLARVNDLTSLALLFPPEEPGERWKVVWQHWCPEDDIPKRVKRDRAPYDIWRDQGWIVATEGNTTDFKFVTAAILEAAGHYNLQGLAYDRTFASEVVQNLMEEGVPCVEFGQGFISMATPTAELERMLIAGELQHGGNPIATWCASNITVRHDPAGNIKPDKERSTEKIDAIVSLIEAIGLAKAPQENERSYIEDGEILVF